MLVSTVVSFSCEGRCTESQQIGLSKRAFPKGEAPSADLLTRRTPVLCAPRERIPSHSLSSCSTTTQLRQATGLCQSRSLGLPWSPSRSALPNLITSDLMSTHDALVNAPLSREVSGRPRQRAFESRSQRALRSKTGYHRAPALTGSHCALTHNCGAGQYYGGLLVEHLSTRLRLVSRQLGELSTSPFTHMGAFSHRSSWSGWGEPLARSLSTCDKGPFG